jgi:nitroimidazol reductase NimA-like FMN-containing flavoprotein (pyridoxamine 5'-phosphate oxidase superfamily)
VKVGFSPAERRFLQGHEICRFATASKTGWPLVSPVSYVLIDDCFYIATDYGTAKLRHVKENPRASLVVDVTDPNRAVAVQGRVRVIEKGTEFDSAYAAFQKKFSWVRADPWKAGEAPFLKLVPVRKSSWGV